MPSFLHDDDAQRALTALSRPLKSHELADAVFPDRSDRPHAARSRSGHAIGRDLVDRGWAVRNDDDTYIAASLANSMPQVAPGSPPEIVVDPNTREVMEVQRRTVGRLASTPGRAQEGQIVIEPTGQIVRVSREIVGRAALPAPQAQAAAQPPQQPPHDFEALFQMFQRWQQAQAPLYEEPEDTEAEAWAALEAWTQRTLWRELQRERAILAELKRPLPFWVESVKTKPAARRAMKFLQDQQAKGAEGIGLAMDIAIARTRWALEYAPEIVPALQRELDHMTSSVDTFMAELKEERAAQQAPRPAPRKAPPTLDRASLLEGAVRVVVEAFPKLVTT